MNPIRSRRLWVAPPTLEKRLDVLRAIETLAAPAEDEKQQRWRAERAATQDALEKLRRDCGALDQAWHEAFCEVAQIFMQSRARRRTKAERHRAANDALLKRGYDPSEPRIPKDHAGGGEWTRNTLAAADNAGIQWGDSLPIPLPDPAPSKPTEPKPAPGLATEIYNATLRAPIRDLGHLTDYSEEIPNAIASVAPGLPIGELPLATSELFTAIRALGGGVLAGATASARAGTVAAEGTAAATDEAFHYTLRRAIASIESEGLRAGSYATPNGVLSPLQAHIDLALSPNRGLTDALLRIDLAGLRQAGYEIPKVTQVGRSFAMPGGGFEMQFPYRIPPKYISVVRP